LTDLSTPTVSGGPSRGLRWLLVGSLALNLAIVGGLAALWFKGPPGASRWGSTQTAFGMMKFSRDLPEDRRQAVRKHLKDARSALKAVRDDLRAARVRAAEVLASADYSPEQMKSALDAVAAADNRMRSMGTEALMKAIGELTPEDRQKLAASWTRRLEREQKRKSKRDKGGETGDEAPGTP
jgi:uncharacterized membrane protein